MVHSSPPAGDVAKKEKDGVVSSHKLSVETKFYATYTSPSDCWEVAFVRKKDFGKDEHGTSYNLLLTVLFGEGKLQRGIDPTFPQFDKDRE